MCLKEECVTDEEDDCADVDVTAEEQQQAEMKAIYSDTPDEHQSTPERGVHDENGTSTFFSAIPFIILLYSLFMNCANTLTHTPSLFLPQVLPTHSLTCTPVPTVPVVTSVKPL